MARIIILIILAFILSYILNSLVPVKYATKIIDTTALSFLSVLVGLAIALYGLLSPGVLARLISFPEGSNSDNSRLLLTEILKQIKDNAIFTLFTYFLVLIVIYIKGLDQSFLRLLRISSNDLHFWMNVLALTLMFLASFAIYDTTTSVMKLHKLQISISQKKASKNID